MSPTSTSTSTSKGGLRDKLDDDTLDLSLMQLTDVPVKEISELPKGTTVDLSNNQLVILPDCFPTLTHITRLDLSKNQLEELPEYFGQLRQLRHLDLYSNRLERLPVSFGHLKNLKWLDLKNNPLVPALAQAAGHCITKADCAMCAKKVVALLQSMQSQLERERQRQIVDEQRAKNALREKEEQEREKIRADKRAAKEKRREDARARENEFKRRENETSNAVRHEMERPRNAGDSVMNGRNSKYDSYSRNSGSSCFRTLCLFLLGVFFVALATGISLIWIYTGGKLDQKSIEKAIPFIRKDAEITFGDFGKKIGDGYEATKPYLEKTKVKAEELWEELGRRQKIAARWAHTNFGPTVCHCLKSLKGYWFWCQDQIYEGWKWLKPTLWNLWLQARPHFQRLGEWVLAQFNFCSMWIQKNAPIYLEWAGQKVTYVMDVVNQWISG